MNGREAFTREESLQRWLDVATKGLVQESRASIAEEIEAHIGEAVEEGLREGKGRDEIAQMAVRNLGSPRQARRAFRRNHLTLKEAMWVGQIVRGKGVSLGWAWRFCLTFFGIFGGASALGLIMSGAKGELGVPRMEEALAVAIGIGLFAISYFLGIVLMAMDLERLPRLLEGLSEFDRTRRALWIRFTGGLLFVAPLCTSSITEHKVMEPLAKFLGMFVLMLIVNIKFVKKLRRVRTIERPPDAAGGRQGAL